MEYMSLPGCIKNTSSDAEDLTEHQLSTSRSPWPPERIIRIHVSTNNWVGWKKEGRRRRKASRNGPPPRGWGAEAGERLHIWGKRLGQKGSVWDCRRRVKQLICDGLNRVRTTWTICAVALCNLDKQVCPPVHMGDGSWGCCAVKPKSLTVNTITKVLFLWNCSLYKEQF